jgi:ABC-type sugar transport system ATPase subunit
VAGLETPDTGLLEVNGTPVFCSDRNIKIPAEERPVSMVFQSYALWPHMDVYNNIVFPLRHGVRRVDSAEIERRVKSVTETLELTPYIRRPISQLSGGQQQRVALARALALEPAVLLMDEPLSNLDAKLRAQLRVDIKNLTKSLGITTLYVTHDQVEAMVMGDRIAVMDGGAIIEESTPDQLYKHPKTEFVAKFLGDMNFVPGQIVSQANGRSRISSPLGTLDVVDAESRASGEKVRVGFRPEDVRQDRRDGDATFQLQVSHRYYVGDAILFQLDIESSTMMVRLHNSSKLQSGETAELSISMQDFSVFADQSPPQS